MEKITPSNIKTGRQPKALVLSVEVGKVSFLNGVKPMLKNGVSFYRDVKTDFRNGNMISWFVQLDDDHGFKLTKSISSSWYISSRELCTMIRNDFSLTPGDKTVRFFLEPCLNNSILYRLQKM